MELLEGTAGGQDRHIAVILNRTDGGKEDRLLAETVRALGEHGIPEDSITAVRIPGTWDIPITLEKTARSEAFDAVVVIGLFDASGCENTGSCTEEIHKRCTAASLKTGKPVTSALVREDEEEAIEKCRRAAMGTLEMIDLLARINAYDREYIAKHAI